MSYQIIFSNHGQNSRLKTEWINIAWNYKIIENSLWCTRGFVAQESIVPQLKWVMLKPSINSWYISRYIKKVLFINDYKHLAHLPTIFVHCALYVWEKSKIFLVLERLFSILNLNWLPHLKIFTKKPWVFDILSTHAAIN